MYGEESPLAFVPTMGLQLVPSDLGFTGRLLNIINFMLVCQVVRPVFDVAPDRMRAHYGVAGSNLETISRIGVAINQGHTVMEWPRPLPPALKFVGPISPEPAKALPAVRRLHRSCIIFITSAGPRRFPVGWN